ncbi:hypothetical protein TNCV_4228511 [Trichonephila clavipes]|nr:hypothetical protein TNCV_4228511 [Trichonephila clavipes]
MDSISVYNSDSKLNDEYYQFALFSYVRAFGNVILNPGQRARTTPDPLLTPSMLPENRPSFRALKYELEEILEDWDINGPES